uniref:Vacuolar protein sorting-associated protein 35 n=1 Tax=Kalanchoe fedtschenkoi TaxID=63787 RepID=A0A7N0UV23_KALFE
MAVGGAEDEDKCLAAGIAAIQQNAFYMHRALDSNNLKDALKYSTQMLAELRTSRLSPHKYYELYMRAFDELRKLEIFFREETRRGCSIVDLYELVQHAGNILPRLYLLCTIGSVYIKSKEAPAKDVLKDLVEMCRGVQHPLRGLFLRSYLSQVSRDKLPDIGSDYEGDEDTVMDAVEFVLQNFTEMNKLWVRMQHQGPARDKEKREKERSELRDLVGKNLHVLSQIEGVDLDLYKDTVLPRVLEQIVNCKDDIAQHYLMDCLIQVFPDEYHLQTLETLLGACPQLQSSVDIKTVLSQLMDRLSNYAASSTEVLPEFLEVDAFSKLTNAIGKVIEAQAGMPVGGAVTLYSSLLTFTLHVHPDRLDFVDEVLVYFC